MDIQPLPEILRSRALIIVLLIAEMLDLPHDGRDEREVGEGERRSARIPEVSGRSGGARPGVGDSGSDRDAVQGEDRDQGRGEELAEVQRDHGPGLVALLDLQKRVEEEVLVARVPQRDRGADHGRHAQQRQRVEELL